MSIANALNINMIDTLRYFREMLYTSSRKGGMMLMTLTALGMILPSLLLSHNRKVRHRSNLKMLTSECPMDLRHNPRCRD